MWNDSCVLRFRQSRNKNNPVIAMTRAILSVAYEEVLAAVAALYGGARYGVKVRLPHSLMMTLLFGNSLSPREKIERVFRLVKEHAVNLASFAAIYKSLIGAMKVSTRILSPPRCDNQPRQLAGQPDKPYHSFIAGAVGGYFVWGNYSSINYQILLYLSSRVLVALGKRIYQSTGREPHPALYRRLSALVWGAVMILFENNPEFLHPSLKNSMDEIYRYPLWAADATE